MQINLVSPDPLSSTGCGNIDLLPWQLRSCCIPYHIPKVLSVLGELNCNYSVIILAAILVHWLFQMQWVTRGLYRDYMLNHPALKLLKYVLTTENIQWLSNTQLCIKGEWSEIKVTYYNTNISEKEITKKNVSSMLYCSPWPWKHRKYFIKT